jgi:UDP-N-acetylglucosamine 2-epimerase
VDYDDKRIEEAIRHQMQNGRYPSDKMYGDGKAGKRIAEILADVEITIQKRLMY